MAAIRDKGLPIAIGLVLLLGYGGPEEPDVPLDPADAAAIRVELTEFTSEDPPKSDLIQTVGTYPGGVFSGRTAATRARMVKEGGGNEASEKAVAAALKWLAEHQWPDGGWSFDLKMTPLCVGKCGNSGSETTARNAATALALLPFLGAGQTHKEGRYKETVNRALYFLVNRMKISPQGGSLHETGGTMYSHGLASIVLCEAYAMTKDKYLRRPAQNAINYIAYAQDPVGGGWRYQPQQAGDTSVTGWQILALKSGHAAYLRISPMTVQKAFRFLDSVRFNGGANFGYTQPERKQSHHATTAIGLLCRMYLGWKRDNPALQKGVQWLAERGPSENDFYYNYFATQVMRQWEGKPWEKWNSVMRDRLIESQATEGHETGSWHAGKGDHGSVRGGRLYGTAMATLILEVYYRHLPIYRKANVEDDFPID